MLVLWLESMVAGVTLYFFHSFLAIIVRLRFAFPFDQSSRNLPRAAILELSRCEADC